MNNENITEIKDKTVEFLFKLTLFITIVHAGFIFWDFLTLIQPFNKLVGISTENSVFSSGSEKIKNNRWMSMTEIVLPPSAAYNVR